MAQSDSSGLEFVPGTLPQVHLGVTSDTRKELHSKLRVHYVGILSHQLPGSFPCRCFLMLLAISPFFSTLFFSRMTSFHNLVLHIHFHAFLYCFVCHSPLSSPSHHVCFPPFHFFCLHLFHAILAVFLCSIQNISQKLLCC